MGPIQSLHEFFSLLRRRQILIGSLTIAGLFLTLVVALSQPRTYEAAAVIQVETSAVDERSDSTPAVNSAARRVQLIELRLMARDNLVEMIERFRLYDDLPALSMPEKVALLRASTRLESISSVQQGYANDGHLAALIITATMRDPHLAATIANTFADSVLRQSTSIQAQRTQEALAFFQEEASRVAGEIASLEAEIASYKNANADTLPGALDDLRTERSRIDEQLRNLDQRLLELLGERGRLERTEPMAAVVQRQIQQVDEEMVTLQQQTEALNLQRAALSDAIARTPEREKVLNTFDRQLQLLQDRYAVASRRLAEAETNVRLDESQNAERFEVIEPAVPPEYAVNSGRRKIAVLGSFASLMLAFAVAFGMDLVNPVIRNSDQMLRELELRPVVAIPYITTESENRRHRRRRLIGMAVMATAALFLMTVTGYGLVT